MLNAILSELPLTPIEFEFRTITKLKKLLTSDNENAILL